MGDFNTILQRYGGEPALDVMDRSFFKDVQGPKPRTWREVDYVFARDVMYKPLDVTFRKVSDHQPKAAELIVLD